MSKLIHPNTKKHVKNLKSFRDHGNLFCVRSPASKFIIIKTLLPQPGLSISAKIDTVNV